ncbi:hypothetical protein UC34_12240 [Pandoraea vervacti]|uniref:PBP domain-containing protein n=1 Tax=Pandoraea vervacti TaxID=656178 RepID=A0ABN4G1W9_9BURK|nr:hypothetical protein UC34_12240 [Pandoraea vervacti]
MWAANKSDCNAFVRAVASQCGVTLTGDANNIILQIQKGGWEKLDGGVAASNAAAAGKLVIGGVSSKDLGDGHGHVVIVVPVPPNGKLAYDKYPYAYWGSLNEAIRDNGGKGVTLNYSFDSVARDKVIYAAYKL